MPKYVVSRTLQQADWNNSTIVADDVVERVVELKRDQNVLVWGSPTLVQTLIDNGLVDEYLLLVSPLVRADGVRLFAGASDQHKLRILDSTLLGGGMLALRMAPAA
jgi:dihydrofolate reductase